MTMKPFTSRYPADQGASAKATWRDYQTELRRTAVRRGSIKKTALYAAVVLILLAGSYGIIGGFEPSRRTPSATDRLDTLADNRGETRPAIAKKDVQSFFSQKDFLNLTDDSFTYAGDGDGRTFRIATSLDIDLQHYLLKQMKTDTSKYIGIVVMEPFTGRVLSMVGYDKTDPLGNPCLDNRFPAASIFKIVTAAAAIEKCGFDSDSRFTYNGRKYTLYKSQLKERINKYTNRITFQDSFAQSINPVFGKIGTHYLGKTALEQYAEAFGFNRYIDFEIPLSPSRVSLTDEPYQWAEIASGFNRATTISPLHGALLGSVILNNGRLVEPTIVDKVSDESGQTLYRSRPVTINQAISPATSAVVNRLMQATVKTGTSRKAFSGSRKDRVLSRLSIGAKTGSIDNSTHDARYDWFVGFAREKKGGAAIVVSVVVAHEKYIGIRAGRYARMAIKQYFQDYFKRGKV